jgi:hypothetical protein
MHRTTVAGDTPTAVDDGPAHVTPPREVDITWGRAQLEVL